MEIDKHQLLIELKNNQRIAAYLSQFEAESAERFLDSYADTKQMLLQFGEQWRQRQHGSTNYFRSSAENFYWLITQKKLFNLQCLWRARQIILPVTITYEFQYWSKNVKSCPFVEDVTEAEIEAMMVYLGQASYDHEEYDPWDWQAYDEFKDEETGMGTSDNYPAWYHAYDNYLGTQHLMALPDVRGKEEEKYLEAWRVSALDRNTTYIPPVKPIMFSNSESTEEFIRKAENFKILDYYRLYRAQTEKMEFMEKIQRELDLFMEEPDEVWIPEGKFPDAIFQAGHLLKVSHIKLLLPEIHQNHLERKTMGISYEQNYTMQEDNLIQTIKEHIEEGRRILGGDKV